MSLSAALAILLISIAKYEQTVLKDRQGKCSYGQSDLVFRLLDGSP